MEEVTMAVMDEAADWARGLDELVERIAPRFCRIEPRRRVRAYRQGLLAPMERKNGWQLAENAGDRTPDAVQDFLACMRWDADRVRDNPGVCRGRLAWGICLSSLIAGSQGSSPWRTRTRATHLYSAGPCGARP